MLKSIKHKHSKQGSLHIYSLQLNFNFKTRVFDDMVHVREF